MRFFIIFIITIIIYSCTNSVQKSGLTNVDKFSINFLRQASGNYIDAISEVVHNGRTSLVVQTTLENDAGECVALITQTQAVRTLEQ